MEDKLDRKKPHNAAYLTEQRYKEVRAFAEKVLEKHKAISSAVLKRPSESRNLLEIVFILDDLNSLIFDPQVEEFRISVSDIAYESTLPLKCEAMLASAFWDGFRSRDDDVMQLAREGLVIYDNGFFLPLQDLLVTGKIRPSRESMDVYFVKAEHSLKTSNQKVGRAVIDLYWAVIDTAHAAVMVAGLTPPSPKHLAEAVRKELVARNLVHRRCADIVDRFYAAAKSIMHKEVFEVSGREFDSYLADADFFLKEIGAFVKEHVDREVTR